MVEGQSSHGYRSPICSPLPEDQAVELVAAVEDQLAEAFHELYRAESDNTAPPWSDLDEAGREANRASARAVPGQLASMGLTVAPAASSSEPLTELPAAAIEVAAVKEHERWMNHKRVGGWVYGPTRRNDTRPPTHPELVPWEELDEPARDKDRVRIAGLPRLLGSVGLVVVAPDD